MLSIAQGRRFSVLGVGDSLELMVPNLLDVVERVGMVKE